MSKRLPRPSNRNRPVLQPITILACGNGVVIFQCLLCDQVHFMSVDVELEAEIRADLDV